MEHQSGGGRRATFVLFVHFDHYCCLYLFLLLGKHVSVETVELQRLFQISMGWTDWSSDGRDCFTAFSDFMQHYLPSIWKFCWLRTILFPSEQFGMFTVRKKRLSESYRPLCCLVCLTECLETIPRAAEWPKNKSEVLWCFPVDVQRFILFVFVRLCKWSLFANRIYSQVAGKHSNSEEEYENWGILSMRKDFSW